MEREKESCAAAQLELCHSLCQRIRGEIEAEETDPEKLSRLLEELSSRTSTIERLSLSGEQLDPEGIHRLRQLMAEVEELRELCRLQAKRLGTRLRHIQHGLKTLSGYQDHTHQSVAALIDRRG